MYKALVAYKREQGHCNVQGSNYGKLAEWIRTQRRRFRRVGNRRKLTNDELAHLNAIDFPWDGQHSSGVGKWDGMLNELLAYKRKHGNCYLRNRYREILSWGRG